MPEPIPDAIAAKAAAAASTNREAAGGSEYRAGTRFVVTLAEAQGLWDRSAESARKVADYEAAGEFPAPGGSMIITGKEVAMTVAGNGTDRKHLGGRAAEVRHSPMIAPDSGFRVVRHWGKTELVLFGHASIHEVIPPPSAIGGTWSPSTEAMGRPKGPFLIGREKPVSFRFTMRPAVDGSAVRELYFTAQQGEGGEVVIRADMAEVTADGTHFVGSTAGAAEAGSPPAAGRTFETASADAAGAQQAAA